MDLNWLEDFVCFARTQNFTRAAQERNITQSAFSRRIQSLELWLGTALIDRKSFYRLVDLGVHHEGWFGVWSGGAFFGIIPSEELPDS